MRWRKSYRFSEITVYGESGASIGGFDLAFIPSNVCPKITAQYGPLVRRTGGTTAQKIVNVNATTLEQGKKAAKRKLKEEIQSMEEGDVTMHGVPMVDIFDRLKMNPSAADKSPRA